MTMTSRPETRPIPVTIPAPGASPSYRPWAASAESSRNGEPGSRSASTRSRTNIFFCSAWRARPAPPCRARATCSFRSRTSASTALERSRNSGERVSTRLASGSMRSRLRSSDFLRGRLADEVHEGLRRGPGQEDLPDAHPLERRDVLLGDDAAGDDEDVLAAALLQELQDLREERVVGAREDREADDVHVLLDRGRRDLLGRLAQPRVDDLHAGVAQRARDDLGAPVVAVEARLGDQDPNRSGHRAAVYQSMIATGSPTRSRLPVSARACTPRRPPRPRAIAARIPGERSGVSASSVVRTQSSQGRTISTSTSPIQS